MAKNGAPSAWILARQQTAGKGSRGRHWETGQGNFSASLLLRINDVPQNGALRSFSAALAVSETLVSLGIDESSISLKWPNDVLVDGKKIAGILLESSGRGQNIDQLIVGIGINLSTAPPSNKLAAAALSPADVYSITSETVDPESVLDVLAPIFSNFENILSIHGFEAIRTRWLQKAARLGEELTVQQGDRSITGTFNDVDTSGALVLTTPYGSHVISTGEIFFSTAT